MPLWRRRRPSTTEKPRSAAGTLEEQPRQRDGRFGRKKVADSPKVPQGGFDLDQIDVETPHVELLPRVQREEIISEMSLLVYTDLDVDSYQGMDDMSVKDDIWTSALGHAQKRGIDIDADVYSNQICTRIAERIWGLICESRPPHVGVMVA